MAAASISLLRQHIKG